MVKGIASSIITVAVSIVSLMACGGTTQDEGLTPQVNRSIATPSTELSSTPLPSPTIGISEPETETGNTSDLLVVPKSIGCTSIGHGEPRREEMLEGHELWLGTLTDLSLEEGYKLLTGGSVPDGLILNGKIHLWWVSAADHTIHRGVVDGSELQDFGSITIDGEILSGMVDPDIVQFEDGSLVLTVLDGFDRSGPPGPICHLRSIDGQNFTTDSTLLDIEERFDPSLVIVQDQWWLAVGIPSQDDNVTEIYSGLGGLNFTYQAEVEGAVPDLSYFDGKFQLLTCSKSGMRSYSSSNGKDWNLDQIIPFQGCDLFKETCEHRYLEVLKTLRYPRLAENKPYKALPPPMPYCLIRKRWIENGDSETKNRRL